MEFNNKITQQAAWDELVNKLSSWRNLVFNYLKSIKDAEPHSDELFNAMKSANNECHMVLDKTLKWILINSASPDNGEIVELLTQEFIDSLFPHQMLSKSKDRQLLITPNVCRIGKPQYESASLSIYLQSDIKINYDTKTNHRILFFNNLNGDSPNSNVLIQSKQFNSSLCYSSTSSPSENIYCDTLISQNPIQCAVKSTLQYTNEDQQKYDNGDTHSFVIKHQQQFRSPTNNYHETQHRNRNRLRSRSCNEQRCKSKSTDSLKNKQESQDGTRKNSRSESRTKSPKRKENVTKYKKESRDRMRKKSASESGVFRILHLTKNQIMKRNIQHKKLQEAMHTIRENIIFIFLNTLVLKIYLFLQFYWGYLDNSLSITLVFIQHFYLVLVLLRLLKRTISILNERNYKENVQQALLPVRPYYQNPNEVSNYRTRISVFVIRPPPPHFMPPRPRLRFSPRPLQTPPIMYRPQRMP